MFIQNGPFFCVQSGDRSRTLTDNSNWCIIQRLFFDLLIRNRFSSRFCSASVRWEKKSIETFLFRFCIERKKKNETIESTNRKKLFFLRFSSSQSRAWKRISADALVRVYRQKTSDRNLRQSRFFTDSNRFATTADSILSFDQNKIVDSIFFQGQSAS